MTEAPTTGLSPELVARSGVSPMTIHRDPGLMALASYHADARTSIVNRIKDP